MTPSGYHRSSIICNALTTSSDLGSSGHRLSDDASAVHIYNDGQRRERRRGRYVGDIGDPQLIEFNCGQPDPVRDALDRFEWLLVVICNG